MCGGVGHMKRENRKSGRSQTVKGLNVRPRRTPEGDSEFVYRLPQPAHHHWFPSSLSELGLRGCQLIPLEPGFGSNVGPALSYGCPGQPQAWCQWAP